MRMRLAFGVTLVLATFAPSAFAQQGADYFSNGAAATTVPQGSPYYTNGAAVTAGRTDSSGLPYYKEGTAVLAAPADTTSANPYFTNGASVTSVPLDTASANPYFNNGAYYKYAPPALTAAPAASAAPEASAAPRLQTHDGDRVPVGATHLSSAPLALAQPLAQPPVYEPLEEELPPQDLAREGEAVGEGEDADNGPSHWLEPAASYAPRVVTARVARRALATLPVEPSRGWAALVGCGAVVAVVLASARHGRRARR